MESLAFIHTAVSYEDTNPDPELKVFENVDLNVSGSALMGLAGAAVAVSVLGGATGKATAATAPVGPGSSGSEVQAIQKALGIQADGKYNAKTETAVMDFQLRQGLKSIDGVVGKETAKALGLDEQYRPMGFVETCSGCGLNIRSGPGLGYYIVGGAPDGAYLYQDYETVVYNEGYAWTPLYSGGWVAADYTTEDYYPVGYYHGGGCGYEDYGCGDDYYPVSYGGGCGEDYGCGGGGYYEEEDYCGGGCYHPYPVAYYPPPYYYHHDYYPVAYHGGCGCGGYDPYY
jgi:hypothetical protein